MEERYFIKEVERNLFTPRCLVTFRYVPGPFEMELVPFQFHKNGMVHPSFTTKICFSHIGIFALEVKDLRKLLYYSSGEISYPSARKKLGILFYKQRQKQLQFHKKAILAKKRRDRDKHPLSSVTTNTYHLGGIFS